jgi:hypothetical protein
MKFELAEELRELSQPSDGPGLSIYMPTHRAGSEVQQNPIRLSNLLREAENQLISLGMRTPDARDFLEPIFRLQRDGFFWRQEASDGLALFLSPQLFRSYRLPFRFAEVVKVSQRFHLKPFLGLLSGDGRFYVLALSQKMVRLIRCTRFACEEVELEGVPKSMDEALKDEYAQRQLQFHTGTQASAGGRRAAMFHGQGVGIDDNKTNILRYFMQINDGLRGILKDESASLILAGVDYLLPIYKDANTYPHLFEQGITGSPEDLSTEELHSKAWAYMQSYFQQEQEDALGKYRRLAGTGLTSDDINSIVPAAYFGRVETLFVSPELQLWGAVDPHSREPRLHEQELPGDNDLLDVAAIQTFLNRGAVFTVDVEGIPGNQPLAAVFRY